LISRAFTHLHAAGVRRFVINTHWQAHAYTTAFPEGSWQECPLAFSHEWPEVLETAGGLKQAAHLLPNHEPFWVYNGDILSTLPLEQAWEAHRATGNEVTLVLRSSDGPLHVLRDSDSGRILDIGRRLHPERDPGHLFTGIYLVEPEFLERIPAATKISVIPIFLEMIRQQARLGSAVVDGGQWWDLGAREQILAVHAHLSTAPADALQTTGPGPWVDASATVAPDAWVSPDSAIGARVHIGSGASLTQCVVWEDAHIAPGTRLHRCIVTQGAHVAGSHSDADL
jgi:NDP-sugar pyrophosphorylase family protein